MSDDALQCPAGSGKHPIQLVVVAARDLAASAAFYARVFGWQAHPVSTEVTAVIAPAGPNVTLRSGVPDGFPGLVPFIAVPDVAAALQQAVAAGGAIEKATWQMPMVGSLARFTDPSGTVYGLISAAPGSLPRVPMPIGANPRPPAGTVCSLEMYASDGTAAARFFGDLFDWGTRETMPQFMAFDPGAGITGVFQSHTPAHPAVAYIYVADVAAALKQVDESGGKRTADPMPVPGYGCFGYFTDPSGTHMGLLGP